MRILQLYRGINRERFFGTGVAISVPKGKWGKLEPEDMAKFDNVIKEGDIVECYMMEEIPR